MPSAEELFDLSNDPGERQNLANDPAHSALLAEYREKFINYTHEYIDPFKTQAVKVDPQWREHKPGYPNHGDDCSLEAYLAEKKAKLAAEGKKGHS